MSIGANRRADAANRRIFVVLAAVLVVAGGLVWAASLGAFTDGSSDVILTASARSTIDDWSWVGWLAAAVLAVVVLTLSWRWLWFELRPHPSLPELTVDADEDDDLTVHVDPSAWLDAVLEDAQSVRGVLDARGRLDVEDDLSVTLLLSARDRVDPHAMAHELDGYVRKRAEHSLDRPVELDVELELVTTDPPGRIV